MNTSIVIKSKSLAVISVFEQSKIVRRQFSLFWSRLFMHVDDKDG